MVFASIRDHAEHCDFFASTSIDKKFALRAASRKPDFLYFPLAAIHIFVLEYA